MVLIPNDIGVRMRLQAEASLLQAATPVAEIPSDLLELRPGQTFSARIQEVLPENTYKALVAGKSITLSLPEGAKAGDTLELVVIDRSPRLVVAQLAEKAAAQESGQLPQFTTLSRAGRLIGSLLLPEGDTPSPAALTRGQPLLAQAPTSGAQLAVALSEAVQKSGLFYESHQAQWLAGQVSLTSLLEEPQGRHSNLSALAATAAALGQASPAGAQDAAQGSQSYPVDAETNTLGQAPLASLIEEAAEPHSSPGSTTDEALQNSNQKSDIEKPGEAASHLAAQEGRPKVAATLLQTLFGREPDAASTAANTAAGTERNLAAGPAGIPDDLKPLVQQQLDALASQRLAWHGEVWPNQMLDWEIDWRQGRSNGETVEDDQWATSLHLTTPRLGEIDVRLQLASDGIRLAITAPSDTSVADLRDALPQLEQSLAAAGVPLRGVLVKHSEAASNGT